MYACRYERFRACERDQRAFRSPFGNLRPPMRWNACKLGNLKFHFSCKYMKEHAFFSILNRRGFGPSDFHSYPPALPAGRAVDFACKINSLHLRTTSVWPKVLPRKSGENHFFDTLNRRGFGPSDTSPEIFRQSDCMKAPFRQVTLPGQNIRPFPAQMTRPAPLICLRLDKAYFRPFSRASSMRCWSRAGFALPPDRPMAAPMSALARFALPL